MSTCVVSPQAVELKTRRTMLLGEEAELGRQLEVGCLAVPEDV